MTLRIGEVADQLGVTTQTLRNWIKRDEFRPFFSPAAHSAPGKTAYFTEEDFEVANSIRALLADGNNDWRSMGEQLRSGWREPMLPTRAAAIAANTNAALQLAGRVVSAEDRFQMVVSELMSRDQQIADLQNKLLNEAERREKLLERMAQYREEKAALQRELELIRAGWQPPKSAG